MENQKNQYKPNSVSHPGLTLSEKLQEMNMGSKEFAVKINKSEKTISSILNGGSSITLDMAVSFESILKIPASFWLNRQKNYDEYMGSSKVKKFSL
jgi:addiction module HigA family antidote